MRRALKIVLAATLAWTASCGDGPSAPGPARSVTQLRWDGPRPANYLGGLDLPVDVYALDAAGKGVPGVTVRFTAEAGSGSFRGGGEAVTDSAGKAHAEWTLGLAGGAQAATAEVVGGEARVRIPLNQVTPGAADPPRFALDTVRLNGVACTSYQEFTGSSRDAFGRFEYLDADFLESLPTMVSGGIAWKAIRFMALRPGTGRVVARDLYGRADTLVVVAGSQTGTVTLPDTVRVAAGDSAVVSPRYGTPCNTLYATFVGDRMSHDTVRFNAASLSPEVASARRTPPSETVTVRGLRAGVGRVVVSFWGGADTSVVVVR